MGKATSAGCGLPIAKILKCDNTEFNPVTDRVATCADIPVVTPAADFWRSGAGATLPDGTTDTSEDISRTGKVGLGTTTPVTDVHIKKAVTGEVGVTVENTLVTANDYADVVTLNGDIKAVLGSYKAGGYGYTGTESNNDFFIYAGNNTAIVVKPNQRVGIGSNASVNNPTDTLYVHNGTAGDSGLTLAGLPSATAPTAGAQPIGVDANGKVVRVAGGGTVTFATPAETIAGTSTTLAVNPADLVARENIPAQTGLSNNLAAIPAPTANQSNWGTNTLGETLHYAPNLGWQIVNNRYGDQIVQPAGVIPTPVSAWATAVSLVAPRDGRIIATGHIVVDSTLHSSLAGGLAINGINKTANNVSSIGPVGAASGYGGGGSSTHEISYLNASLSWTGYVTAGTVIAIQGITVGAVGQMRLANLEYSYIN